MNSGVTFTGTAAVKAVKAEAYWNLQLFLYDRSDGIHNPTFAAQILWDSINALNTVAGAGIPLGATRPTYP